MTVYVHGVSRAEQERLERQHRLVGGTAFLPRLRPGLAVLDVGCGIGMVACGIGAKIAPGRVLGIDRHLAQLAAARRRAGREGLRNVSFRIGKAESLDLPDASFDLVVCRFLLEHVADPLAVLDEMKRVTRPGGRVVACECFVGCCSATEPALPGAARAMTALYRLQRRSGGDPDIGTRLPALLEEAGLADVRARDLTRRFTARADLRHYASGGMQMVRGAERRLLKARLVSRRTLDAAYREWTRFPDLPGACATFRIRSAVGRRRLATIT